MTRPSPLASAFICVLLVPSAIALGAAGRQSATQTQEKAAVWSIYFDPARKTATGTADSAQNRTDAEITRIAQRTREWKWGDLLAGRTYRGAVTLSNQCKNDVRVGIFAYGLPDLLIPPTATIPAGGRIGLPYRIRPTADTNQTIRGELVVWLPPGTDPECRAFRLVHDVSGQVRAATPKDEVVEKAMLALQRTAEGCIQWWLTGEKPTDRTEAECAPIVRRAAIRARQLMDREEPAVRAAASRLPTIDAIGAMSIAELRALRRDFATALAPSK
ncbi:MAG TPA: hypothetical protein VH740_21860 [Vicinamibacterales bacterium]|jgi:hypothetical protein